MESGEGAKVQRAASKVYVSRTKIEEIFEKHIRGKVEKKYEKYHASNSLKEVASFKVGLKETNIAIDVKFWKYRIHLDKKKNEINFILLDQEVKGNLLLHIEKAAKILINFGGDFINKDYQINFKLQIKLMEARAKVKPNSTGFPEVTLDIVLPNTDLLKDLEYKVENSDLLTDTINLVKSLWISELENEIKKSLLPLLNNLIAKVINEEIRSIYRTEYSYSGEKKDINLHLNLECEGFEVNNNFAIVTLNGFVNNINKPRKSYSVLPQGYILPDISKLTSEDFCIVQVSDDIIHSAVSSYFLNDLNFNVDFNEAGCKQMSIKHNPAESVSIAICRDDDIYGSELFLQLETRFLIVVKHKIFPDVSFGIQIRMKISNIRIIEKPERPEHMSLAIRISDIKVVEMFDYKMEQMSDTMRKSKVVSTVKEKASTTVVNKSIEIKKVKIGRTATFEAISYTVYDEFVSLVGKLLV